MACAFVAIDPFSGRHGHGSPLAPLSVNKRICYIFMADVGDSDVPAWLEALKPSKPSPVKPGQAQAVRRLDEGSEPGLNSSKARAWGLGRGFSLIFFPFFLQLSRGFFVGFFRQTTLQTCNPPKVFITWSLKF
jgi:hypothetical protein